MVKDLGNEWKIKLDDDQIVKFFKDNYKYFKNYAGDIETFLFYVKLEHSKRLFCNNKYDVEKKIINYQDVISGYEKFKKNKNVIKNEVLEEIHRRMYL